MACAGYVGTTGNIGILIAGPCTGTIIRAKKSYEGTIFGQGLISVRRWYRKVIEKDVVIILLPGE